MSVLENREMEQNLMKNHTNMDKRFNISYYFQVNTMVTENNSISLP